MTCRRFHADLRAGTRFDPSLHHLAGAQLEAGTDVPLFNELSNSLPLWSGADGSYSQPVYSHDGILPGSDRGARAMREMAVSASRLFAVALAAGVLFDEALRHEQHACDRANDCNRYTVPERYTRIRRHP